MDATSRSSQKRTSFRHPEKYLAGINPEMVAGLLERSADIALVIENGLIRDIAVGAEDLHKTGIAESWIGKAWIDTVSIESRGKIEDLLNPSGVAQPPRGRQVNHASGGMRDVPIAYKSMPSGRANGVIALGRDQRQASELQQRLVKAQQDIERDYSQMRKAEARYKIIFETVADAILIVGAGDLRIEVGNRASGLVLGLPANDLAKRDLDAVFSPHAGRAVERLAAKALASGAATADKVELRDGRKTRVMASVFGQGPEARLIVKLDVPAGESDAGFNARAAFLIALEELPDALVITDEDLRILVANRAFLEMAHLADEDQAIGGRLSQYLGRSSTDINVLMSSLKSNGALRNFATVMNDRFNSEEQVEVSAVATRADGAAMFGFSIRNVSRRLNLDPPISEELPRSVDHLTNLVGRMPLRDIVRDSTTLIERLCIEAALNLTNDNRASAAEMLGLSRQGLYSKLKRFGFEDKS